MSIVSSARADARPSTTPFVTATARSSQAMGPAPVRVATPPKSPRRDLARLQVVAEICPQVFLRTLGLIAHRGIMPLSMTFERSPRRMRFEIEVEGLPEPDAASLAAKVVGLVHVRSVRWLRPHLR